MNIKLKKIKEWYINLNIAVKVGIWYTFCNIIQRGVSIITVPIFTRVLSTEQYGMYSLYLSWLNILSVFTSLNLYYGVFNKAMVKYEDDRDRYVSAMQGLTITLSVIFFTIYILFRKEWNKFFGLSTVVMCMMCLEMLVTPSLQFWSGRQRFEYKYKALVIISIIKTVLNPVLGIAAVLLSVHKTEARIFATLVVEMIICGSLMIYQFIKGKAFYVKKYWKYSILFNIPLIPHYLSGTLLNQGDRIVIQKLGTATEVALYSVAYNVGMLTQLITNAISQAVTPWLYGCLKRKEYKDINKRLDVLMILVGMGCFLLMLFAPEIVYIFASRQYNNAVYVIPPIAASVFFIYVYNIYSNFEFYFEKRIFITIASVISAAVNIVLNCVFIPIFGYVAAGYTTLVCYFIYAYAHYIFSNKICIKQLGGLRVFKPTVLNIMSVIMIMGCFIVSLLYKVTLIRYCVICVYVLIIFSKRKKIMDIMNMIKNK